MSVELFYNFSLILVTLNTFQAIHTEISCVIIAFHMPKIRGINCL